MRGAKADSGLEAGVTPGARHSELEGRAIMRPATPIFRNSRIRCHPECDISLKRHLLTQISGLGV